MERESFVFYRSFFEAAQTLEDGDRVLLYDMIAQYGLDGVQPKQCRSPAYGMFLLIKPQIDANIRKYLNGTKGGRPKKPKENLDETEVKPRYNLDITEAEPNVNDNVNVNVNDKGSIVAKTKRFRPPTVQEVEDYAREKGYSVDAERFVDFYESKGWVVGRAKMKDWKAAVRNWARDKKPAKQGKLVNYDQRQIDYDSLLGIGG